MTSHQNLSLVVGREVEFVAGKKTNNTKQSHILLRRAHFCILLERIVSSNEHMVEYFQTEAVVLRSGW